MLRVTGFDHLVLVVADVERSLDWYCGHLGLAGVRIDEWRRGEAPFPSARVSDGTIIDFVARGDRPAGGGNVDHICLVVDPTDFSALGALGDLGPGQPRFGAQGMGTTVYIDDPDGNTVELRYYGERSGTT
jgi:catechol 2,3-dioxygenase-like lactoylglutathione lyase family enzyme